MSGKELFDEVIAATPVVEEELVVVDQEVDAVEIAEVTPPDDTVVAVNEIMSEDEGDEPELDEDDESVTLADPVVAVTEVMANDNGVELVEEQEDSDINFKSDFVNESIDMTPSKTEGFDPNAVASGLDTRPSDDDGGIVVNKTTRDVFDGTEGGLYEGKTMNNDAGAFELAGFTVMADQYKTAQTKVSASFNTIDDAKACVNGEKFIYVKNGAIVISTISSGTPIISNSEQELERYVNGKWQRA